jgi:nucleotide-binding universal stress UspA family protein
MTSRYDHVLIATDFSDESMRALKVGGAMAKHYGARLTLAHAYDAKPYMRLLEPRSPAEAQKAMGDAALKELAAMRKLYFAGVDVEVVAVAGVSAALTICEHAATIGASLIVVGTRGRGAVMRVLVGSVAEQIVRHATCDVMVVRGDVDDWSPKHIVAPTDLSEVASSALRAAAELQKTFDADVALVHVYDDDVPVPAMGKRRLKNRDEVVNKLHGELTSLQGAIFAEDAAVVCDVLVGEHPGDVVCTYLEEKKSDLVVVSSHGRTGLASLLLGSVAEQIIRYAPCPALAVRVRAQLEDDDPPTDPTHKTSG